MNKKKVIKKPSKSGYIKINEEKCHQCGICEMACSLTHEGVCSPYLSRITLKRDPLHGESELSVCKQCDFPECYYSCPVNAIKIDEKAGARFIVEEECIGCGSCVKACPVDENENILKYNEKKNVYIKCDLCKDRENGPACVEACPWGALEFVEK
ncbi:MAG: 4Fe-4S dicluster domain-containing protein [bacterium]